MIFLDRIFTQGEISRLKKKGKSWRETRSNLKIGITEIGVLSYSNIASGQRKYWISVEKVIFNMKLYSYFMAVKSYHLPSLGH